MPRSSTADLVVSTESAEAAPSVENDAAEAEITPLKPPLLRPMPATFKRSLKKQKKPLSLKLRPVRDRKTKRYLWKPLKRTR